MKKEVKKCTRCGLEIPVVILYEAYFIGDNEQLDFFNCPDETCGGTFTLKKAA